MPDSFFSVALFLSVAFVFAAAAVAFSFVVARRNPNKDKCAPYECGFSPLCSARGKCDIRFYLVALLFMLFDVVVAFLFPWAVALQDIGASGFWSGVAFLSVIGVGFVYEWKKGALEWD